MSKLARTIPVVAIAATALMAVPSGAGAATQIGETFTPTDTCAVNFTRLQTISPGNSYVVPTDGVITQWNFQAVTANSPMRFKAARPAGGISYTVIGDSEVETPVAGILNSYFTRIPVKAGDIIGEYTQGGPLCGRFIAGFESRRSNLAGDIRPPTTTDYILPFIFQLDLSALLEADCDNDGFGDETQDPDISSCAPPPPGTPPGPGIPPPGSPPGTPPVTCGGLNATIVGTSGSDVRTGSQGRDVIAGLGGNDKLSGIAGNDVICGGAGKDTLKGGKGKDKLYGQKGKDTLKGGPGADTLKGGAGKDKQVQ
jgi:RTX calcium-binding nonapeptide repeat (4 copies)